ARAGLVGRERDRQTPGIDRDLGGWRPVQIEGDPHLRRRDVRLVGGDEDAEIAVPILHQGDAAGVGLYALRQIHAVDAQVEPGRRRRRIADAGRAAAAGSEVDGLGGGTRVV